MRPRSQRKGGGPRGQDRVRVRCGIVQRIDDRAIPTALRYSARRNDCGAAVTSRKFAFAGAGRTETTAGGVERHAQRLSKRRLYSPVVRSSGGADAGGRGGGFFRTGTHLSPVDRPR